MLLKPPHEHFPLPLVLMSHQIILAEVFVACTFRMALIEAEDFIDRRPSTELVCNHLSRTRGHRLAICWILELAIPFVARTLSRILTAVCALAELGSPSLLEVLSDVVVDDNVRLDVLKINIVNG